MITSPITTAIIENIRRGTNLLSSSLLSGSQTGSREVIIAQTAPVKPGNEPGIVIIDAPKTSPASPVVTLDDLAKEEKIKKIAFLGLAVWIISRMRF